MKLDLELLRECYNGKECPWWDMIKFGFIVFITLPVTIIWRFIIGALFVLVGIAKIFKPREKYVHVTHYEHCPQCGKELTIYDHREYSEGSSYILCPCGYDSREEA